MNDRLVTIAGALIALLLVVGLFLQPAAQRPVTLPTSIEVGPNGYRAMADWLDRTGLPVVSLREPFTTLAELQGSGHLLMTTTPHQKPLDPDETVALLSWVARGNALVVLTALDDTPDWSLTADTSSFIDDTERLTGTLFEAAVDANGDSLSLGDLFLESEIALVPTDADAPLNTRVDSVTAVSDSTASVWVPAEGSVSPGDPFIAEESSSHPAGWVDGHGRGSIVTIAVGSPFTNRALAKADNRDLLANLLRWHLTAGGSVLFDDYHQGLSNLYDPEAFFSDSRVGVSVLFILAFWFVYMVGTQNRLAPVRSATTSPRQGDFVTAMGGFLARKVSRMEAARLLFARFFAELEARGRLERGLSPWDYLHASPLVDDDALRRLRTHHERMQTGESVDLKTLSNDIRSLREALG